MGVWGCNMSGHRYRYIHMWNERMRAHRPELEWRSTSTTTGMLTSRFKSIWAHMLYIMNRMFLSEVRELIITVTDRSILMAMGTVLTFFFLLVKEVQLLVPRYLAIFIAFCMDTGVSCPWPLNGQTRYYRVPVYSVYLSFIKKENTGHMHMWSTYDSY